MSKSIMHSKASHTCYLCMALNNDYTMKFYLEEHHVFGGNPNRRHSEHYGLKVYLCPEHHRTSDEAVHRPDRNGNQKMLQAAGQREFEKWYPGEDFVKIFGKNYCEEGDGRGEGKKVKAVVLPKCPYCHTTYTWLGTGDDNPLNRCNGSGKSVLVRCGRCKERYYVSTQQRFIGRRNP